MNIKVGESKPAYFRNQRLRGLKFNLYAVSAVVNVPQVQADSLPETVSVKVVLHRRGKKIDLYQGDLRTAHKATNYLKNIFNLCAVGGAIQADILLAAGGAVKEVRLWTYMIDFGSCVHLQGDDELEVSVNSNSTSVSAAIDAGVSYFDVDTVKTQGDEHFTPILITHTVGANEGRWEKNFPHEVTEVLLVNDDKTSTATADAVVDNLTVTGEGMEKHDESLVYNDLIHKNRELHATSAEFLTRKQTFVLYSGDKLSKVKVNILFIKANVGGGTNTIVARCEINDPEQVVLAANTRNAHEMTKAVKTGLVSSAKAAPHIAMSVATAQAIKVRK